MIAHRGPSWKSSNKAPKRRLKTALRAPHFYEDVSGEMAIFENQQLRERFQNPSFFEDVSGEIVIFNIKCFKREPPNISILGGCLKRNGHFGEPILT